MRPYYSPIVRPPLVSEGRDVPAEIVAASVLVQGNTGAGSGTVVRIGQADGIGVVLTNRHVVEGSSRFTLIFAAGQRVEASVLAVSASRDLALLTFAAAAGTVALPLAAEAPRSGAAIYQVGYPLGRRTSRVGTILGYRPGHPPAPNHLLVSFNVVPGDSGSGVILAKERALCGVIWGYVSYDAAGLGARENSAVELRDVAAFVEACLPRLRKLGPAPVRPPPEVAPAVPPTGSDRDRERERDLERIRADVEALRQAIKPGVDKAELDKLLERLKLLERGGEDVRGILGKLGEDIEEARRKGLIGLDAAGKMRERIEGLKALVESAGATVGPLAGVAGKVAAMEAKASWLPWIAGAAGTGGASLAGLAVLWLARRGIKKAIEGRSGSQTSVLVTPAPAPIKETILRSESKYVPVEVPSEELASLKWAMDELARRYPGQIAHLEQLKAYAAQHLSGRKL